MESLMKPVTLSQDVSKVLDEIRAGAENALYGAGPDVSEELFAKHVVSLVEGAGLPVLQTMHYRWYLRELTRLWRTRRPRPRVPPRTLYQKVGRARPRTQDAPVPRLRVLRKTEGKGPYHKDTKTQSGIGILPSP